MVIRVEQGKGRKDTSMLLAQLLGILHAYWRLALAVSGPRPTASVAPDRAARRLPFGLCDVWAGQSECPCTRSATGSPPHLLENGTDIRIIPHGLSSGIRAPARCRRAVAVCSPKPPAADQPPRPARYNSHSRRGPRVSSIRLQ
jgi:hypothetical protein